MVKINFNTPFPHSQRDVFIHSFKELGFKYERIIQNGDYSLFRFFGSLPQTDKSPNIDIIIGNDVNIDDFKQLLVSDFEVYLMFERS